MIKANPARSILIVEDEVELRDLMSEKLIQEGYRVIGCATVGEALKRCAIQRFGCLILDYQLDKGGTGAEIVITLRRNAFGLNFATPVLMISAHLNSEIIVLLADKIDSALVKPVEPDVFIAKVKQLCPMMD